MVGGMHGSQERFNDCWALNLRDAQAAWRQLPDPPLAARCLNICNGTLEIYRGKAYVVQLEQTIRILDLASETWSIAPSRMRDGTPWSRVFPQLALTKHASGVYGDKLYVFGGTDAGMSLGRNVLMSMDFKTLQWEILSGTIEVKPDPTMPGPRGECASWMTPEGKLYVAFGGACRPSAYSAGDEQHGSIDEYYYRDMWSYSIADRTWTREKLLGNPPSHRSLPAATFNPVWNHAVLFGGCFFPLPFVDDETGKELRDASFADTFVWSGESGRWKQVVTRSFPTYRAGGTMVVDRDTGRTFILVDVSALLASFGGVRVHS